MIISRYNQNSNNITGVVETGRGAQHKHNVHSRWKLSAYNNYN